MLNIVRSSLHRVITSPVGDGLSVVRVPKDIARRFNALVGEPICSTEEIARRKTARERLADLRSGKLKATATATARVEAPVMVYFEKERNMRFVGRIEETLKAKNIKYTLLDVTGDETTKDFVMREARVKEDELPVVFIAGTPVGGFEALVAFDVAGKLEKAAFPEVARAAKA